MANIDKYIVRSSKQILTYLKTLSQERCVITAAFGNDDKDSFLTAIMDIDEKKQTITIDCGPREYLNKKLINSAIIKCTTKYNGIEVLFEGRKVVKSGTSSQPAFILPLPKSIFWIQRRQFYRIKSPLSKNSYCSISFKKPETDEQISHNFPLYDLSASGISFINDSLEHKDQLLPFVQHLDCVLALENESALKIDIEVRNERPVNPSQPEKLRHIGCLIINPSPRIESTILRYMQNIEREIKKISK